MNKGYIDKEAVDKICEMASLYAIKSISYEEDAELYSDALFQIQNLSSADVAPVVRGEWKGEVASNLYITRICSVCGERTTEDLFCSRCGADMRKEEN